MGMSFEKHCGNCFFESKYGVAERCMSCADYNLWLPNSYMCNKYTPNQLRKAVLGKPQPVPAIKDVIFNPPATIVKWGDGTKTVVKCQEGDEFDPEKGIAMAIAKKAMGNTGSYFNHIKKWVQKYEDSIMMNVTFNVAPSAIANALNSLSEDFRAKCLNWGSDPK